MSHTSIDRRRAGRRRCLEEHGIVAARVRPGQEVRLLDVSAGGALVESRHRLLPGGCVELHLDTPHHRVAVRGRILRSQVSRLSAATIWYEGAIAFDGNLSWYTDEETSGYLVHTGNGWSSVPLRADATRQKS